MEHGLPERDGDDDAPADLCAYERTHGSAALDALYREESPRLLRSLARRTSSREEARDLVQEIFCRIARLGSERLQRVDRPQAYLSRMAANLLRDNVRADDCVARIGGDEFVVLSALRRGRRDLARLASRIVNDMRGNKDRYIGYQQRTSRPIPVIVLTPR